MEETKKQIEQMITEYLENYKGDKTLYLEELQRGFKQSDLFSFIYKHLAEIGGWEEGSLLYHLNPDIEGILFGRVLAALNKVYNDQSDGEIFFEQDMMLEAIYHLRALLHCGLVSWSRVLLLSEVQRKEKLGHFNQVPGEYEVFSEYMKKFA